MNKWLGRVDIDDVHKFMVMTSVIFLISALFIPFILVFIAQDLLFHSRDHWYFGTPISAYLLAGAGMLTLPVIAIIYSVLKMMGTGLIQRSGTISLVLLLMLGAGIPFYVLGVNSYYIFDDKGVHINEPTTTEVTSFHWDEIQYFIPEVTEDSKVARYSAFHFINKDEELISIPYNSDFSHVRSLIIDEVETHGGEALERKTTQEWQEWIETRQP